ncbi:hypothetical protein CEXT_77301 [Caerostris extrusa]|uniref:Uncharacterized protein n=1 Tax=Caerostris extrusa TaxID=172846 RepID=A0AAV4UAM4_CAEEX|nr:hypothetical protein CEXT_77301 [Caerostris extrusa]
MKAADLSIALFPGKRRHCWGYVTSLFSASSLAEGKRKGKRRPRGQKKKRKKTKKKRIRRTAAVRSLQPLPMVRPEIKLSLRLIESCCRTLGKKNKRRGLNAEEMLRKRIEQKYMYKNKRRSEARWEVVPTIRIPINRSRSTNGNEHIDDSTWNAHGPLTWME